MRLWNIPLCAMCLTSCAEVTAIQVDPVTNKRVEGVAEGIRYYLPKPFLLVTELPVSPQMAPSGQSDSAAAVNGNKQSKANTAQNAQASVPAAAATDTSFAAAMVSYSAKIVYLPDTSHPMALQMHSGLFGTVAMAPTLQDGWMLTSLNGSDKSGGPEALSALASIVGSATGGVATGGASHLAGAATPAGAAVADYNTDTTQSDLLRAFEGQEVSPLVRMKVEQRMRQTAQSRYSQAALAQAKITWGRNVLPPGLYSLDEGVPKAVAFFCNDGVEAAAGNGTTPCLHP